MKFEIKKQLDGTLARVGVIKTAHGNIQTPSFVAAGTKGTVKALTMKQVDEVGAQAILANTYHLLLQPGVDLISQAGGLAEFMGYDGPTFTDSGGFQIMSLPDAKISADGVEFKSHIDGAKLTMTPESSMQAQHKIGSDIHIAFDCPIGYGESDTSRESAEKTMAITHEWAERCLKKHQKLTASSVSTSKTASQPGLALASRRAQLGAADVFEVPTDSAAQALFGVIQGGEFEDLRKQSAEFFADKDFDGFCIGGMYTAEQGQKFLPIVNKILPNEKPRHWLGMGAEPRDLFVGVENGIDTFDCVAPTRQARNGALYTHDGRINIQNAKYKKDFGPIDTECDCWTCQNHTASYLHHLFKAGELSAFTLATIHNERFVIRLVDTIRASIKDGNFIKFRDEFLKRYYK